MEIGILKSIVIPREPKTRTGNKFEKFEIMEESRRYLPFDILNICTIYKNSPVRRNFAKGSLKKIKSNLTNCFPSLVRFQKLNCLHRLKLDCVTKIQRVRN